MKITTSHILTVLYVISWIIFVGVCIEAGGFISNSLFTLFVNPLHAAHFWGGIDFSSLYAYDHGYFFVVTLVMSIVAVLRAVLFYQIIKILHSKKLDLSHPFNREVGRFISIMSYIALFIGFQSSMGVKYIQHLVMQGVKLPDIQNLRLGGADVWLFMGVTLLVIAQIFKRGIEMQTENELTV